jgi:hypothetical protein
MNVRGSFNKYDHAPLETKKHEIGVKLIAITDPKAGGKGLDRYFDTQVARRLSVVWYSTVQSLEARRDDPA